MRKQIEIIIPPITGETYLVIAACLLGAALIGTLIAVGQAVLS
jgi:hypothetical protein